jgi:ankyrin repeat protein
MAEALQDIDFQKLGIQDRAIFEHLLKRVCEAKPDNAVEFFMRLLAEREEKDGEFLDAVKTGDTGKLEQYLAKGYDINARTPKGHTGLTLCIIMNKQELAMWLLEHGASPDVVADDGNTPYYLAVLKDQEEVAEKARTKSSMSAAELDEIRDKATKARVSKA